MTLQELLQELEEYLQQDDDDEFLMDKEDVRLLVGALRTKVRVRRAAE